MKHWQRRGRCDVIWETVPQRGAGSRKWAVVDSDEAGQTDVKTISERRSRARCVKASVLQHLRNCWHLVYICNAVFTYLDDITERRQRCTVFNASQISMQMYSALPYLGCVWWIDDKMVARSTWVSSKQMMSTWCCLASDAMILHLEVDRPQSWAVGYAQPHHMAWKPRSVTPGAESVFLRVRFRGIWSACGIVCFPWQILAGRSTWTSMPSCLPCFWSSVNRNHTNLGNLKM